MDYIREHKLNVKKWLCMEDSPEKVIIGPYTFSYPNQIVKLEV